MGIDLTPSSQAQEELENYLREHQNEFYPLAYSYVSLVLSDTGKREPDLAAQKQTDVYSSL